MREMTNYWRYFGFDEAPFEAVSKWYGSDFSGYGAIAEYLETRTREAGGPLRPLFRPSAIRRLSQVADGQRATLDALCIESLEASFAAGELVVTGAAVDAALEHRQSEGIALPTPASTAEKAISRARRILTIAAVDRRVHLGALIATVAVIAFTLGTLVGAEPSPAPVAEPVEPAVAEVRVRPIPASLQLSRRLALPAERPSMRLPSTHEVNSATAGAVLETLASPET